MVAAYDDGDGVTAEFNLNMLHRLNRELGADFDPRRFRHRVLWNPAQSRIEMHLESARDQRVRIAAARPRPLFRGGRGHSHREQLQVHEAAIRSLLGDAVFEVEHTWTDERGWYSVTLAESAAEPP